jgi:hemoglobin-like flavoprotein
LLEIQQRLTRLLEAISSRLQADDQVSITDLTQAIEVSTMAENLFNKHYTPEQRQYLDKRKEVLGDKVIQQVENDWQKLFAAVQE